MSGPRDLPPMIAAAARRTGFAPAARRGRCQWFLNCKGKTVGVVAHATLGDVPVCESCRVFATGGSDTK